jgi:transposase
MKKHTQHLIAEIPRRSSRVGTTIGIDLGDIWSHYCTLNEDGEVVDRGRFRTSPSGVDKRFRDLEPVRIAMEAGTHSIWISEQIQELGHEVIVARVRELRAISHSDRKSDKVDAEKLARYARLDPGGLRPIAHRTVAQQETLTLIRARDVLVRLRTGAVNSIRGLAKPCGCRLPASSTLTFAKRCVAVLPPGLSAALSPLLQQIADMTVKIKQYDRAIHNGEPVRLATDGDRRPCFSGQRIDGNDGVAEGRACCARHRKIKQTIGRVVHHTVVRD